MAVYWTGDAARGQRRASWVFVGYLSHLSFWGGVIVLPQMVAHCPQP